MRFLNSFVMPETDRLCAFFRSAEQHNGLREFASLGSRISYLPIVVSGELLYLSVWALKTERKSCIDTVFSGFTLNELKRDRLFKKN